MKRLLRQNRRGATAEQDQDDHLDPARNLIPPIGGQHHSLQPKNHAMSRMEPARHFSTAPDGRPQNGGAGDGPLPIAWRIDNMSLMHSNSLYINMHSIAKITVYPNRPISKSLFQHSSGRGGRGQSNGHDISQVFYFEVTFVSSRPSSTGDFSIGLMCETDTHGAWPGEIAHSIGWGADGLHAHGRRLDSSQAKIYFRSGETIGCGVELGGSHRVFFTRNGNMMVPLSQNISFSNSVDLPWYPVVSFRNGNGDLLQGNFGTDNSTPFVWGGSDRMSIVSAHGQHQSRHGYSRSMGNLPPTNSPPRHRSVPAGGQSNSPYAMRNVASVDHDPFSNGNQMMTRSMPPSMPPQAGMYPSHSAHSPESGRPSYYGVKSSQRRSLVEDDPADLAATINEHFTLNPTSAAHTSRSDSNPPSDPLGPAWRAPQRVVSSPAYPSDFRPGNPGMIRSTSHDGASSSRRDLRRQERAKRRGEVGLSGSSHDTPAASPHSPSSSGPDTPSVPAASRMPMSLPPPRSAVAGNGVLMTTHKREYSQEGPPSITSLDSRVPSVAVASGDDVPRAKEHAKELLAAAKQSEIDGPFLRDLLEKCKADQEKLQRKLSNALEEADAIEDLEELFTVNDGICSAIDAGNEALKREKVVQQKKKKKSVEGPTIELLVENEDVFSLICMLRAPNEKRTAAAMALMKFARENETLRNEIRSSGGMHSFLTLFRTKGATHELQVVASMAVAYILPSFVVSSQTSSSVGLKIIECLRFLAVTYEVDAEDFTISRKEMLKAASMGVNVLWINAIQPLLFLESTKDEPKQSRPALRPSASFRIGRVRGRAGGSIFDQGKESIEIRELTELAVTLITHMAKNSDSPSGDPLDVGYNIVEQVCEADAARPIAVREGLLTTLVEWIRSKQVEKIRPAASALRYLISIKDRYMAGWIHSQVVNEGAVSEIVKLLTESVGHDVRVAVAQMISALCVAPHTRAAVVEARCVSYLVALLYEHNAPASEDMVRYAASALLQLAAGAMVRATALSMNDVAIDAASPDQQETVITEIIEGWAHGSFVQIALDHSGKLRSVSVEALRVLSEDTDEKRQTRLQLCSVGAGEALGKTLREDSAEIRPLMNPDSSDPAFTDPESSLLISVKDVHEAIRGLANILEPQKELSPTQLERRPSGAQPMIPKEMLIKACVDVVKSGGLDCIMWISSLPYSPTPLSDNAHLFSADRMDLLEETCRLLANLSPLLLTEAAANEGCGRWASAIYDALHGILVRLEETENDEDSEGLVELNFDALKGLGALARSEPLKIRIVDKSLPRLLALKSLSDDKNDLSTAASQVLLSLGFTEDEITVQVAGNNPMVLVDWFCLQRALLLQAMARAELRTKVIDMWQLPYGDIDGEITVNLRRQISTQSNMSTSQSDDRSEASEENPVMQGLFENFTGDRESRENREAVLEQYRSVYGDLSLQKNSVHSDPSFRMNQSNRASFMDEASLLKSHVYPLNDISVEKDWILSHYSALESAGFGDADSCPVGVMPDRIEKFLDCCFPSRVLRNAIVPFNDIRTQASFNFRALMMPQRRYFSFRREGQLLARLCEKQAGLSDTDEVHWSLGFTNSTFAGEFVESLVQTLYLCPMITALSFARNSDWLLLRDADTTEIEAEDGGGLLANLAGSLPPWVSFLTFDSVLQDRDLRALVAIIDTMGKLSSGGDEGSSAEEKEAGSPSVGKSQGKFTCVGIRNSPQISRESWSSFFGILGKSGPAKRGPNSMPLSSLTILDLSGNKLGDELAAKVIELVHDKDSGCNLEQLDLSGNRIGRGTNMVHVLRSYTEYFRYNQKVGAKMVRKGWKSSLHTLILADNDLFLGQAGLEIFALLKHNALCLRFLDLSNNGLEGDTYQLLASSLLKNTSLCHLDLSSNKFSSSLIDNILGHINGGDAESSLSFLLFENNSPPLNTKQRNELGRFLRKSRKNAILRLIKQREKGETEEMHMFSLQGESQRGLGLIQEDETDTLDRPFGALSRMRPASMEDSLAGGDEGDNMITVLFSAPLVFADEMNKLHPFAKLDFDMERELLWQCMKEASRDIELSFDTAHHSRLLATLTKRCSCLHYSGHGHPHFLPFEDGMGGPNWLNVQDIKELIVRDGSAPFKFVFVSACHSGLAGETFASAGVPHVVCCQQEQELKDTAALAFTRSFYLALAVGNTVKESFEQGCKAVRATPNLKDPEKEMEKFVLLPKDGNHNVPVFNAKPVREWPKQHGNQGLESHKSTRRRGSLIRMRSAMVLGAKSSELGTRNMMQEDPSPTAPQFFIGREVDMYYLLTALFKMNKRLVNVLGEPGIGRSSLVCAVCHYINERASTVTEIQRIYFIKPKHGGRNVTCRSLLRQLLDKLKEAGKCSKSEDDNEVEGMLDIISRSLKNERALIVLDRVELLEKSDDAQELPMILSTLLYETKQVKVVLTGKHSLGQPSIGGQVEHPFNLGPLNFANSVRLFGNLCPHLHTPSERGLFFAEIINECGECSQMLPGDQQLSERARTTFAIIGDGVPAKIEKAAFSISKEDLIKLRRGN